MPSGSHGHGCQDVPPSPPPPITHAQSSTSSNIINKANKRGPPDDEQVISYFEHIHFSSFKYLSSLNLHQMVLNKQQVFKGRGAIYGFDNLLLIIVDLIQRISDKLNNFLLFFLIRKFIGGQTS